MTPQQLLIPRYEVIEDWPKPKNVVIEVGDIFTGSTFMTEMFYCVEKGGGCLEGYLKKYPHLFRPLHWSERREIGEMPDYVESNGKIYKLSNIMNYFKSYPFGFKPATETDYLNYINANK